LDRRNRHMGGVKVGLRFPRRWRDKLAPAI